MMMKRSLLTLSLAVAALGATGCIEHTRELLEPTGPSEVPAAGAPAPGNGGGALTGLWASQAADIPASWDCGSFQWNITEQTPTSIAGSFSAACSGVLTVSGTASGRLNGNEVPFEVTGAAAIGGVTVCPFVLRGTGVIEGTDAIRIPYTGDTCLGPVHGEETLRRPASGNPEPPGPAPTTPPGPEVSPSNPHHVAAGPLDAAQAERVVYATGNEFAHLTTPRGSSDEAIGAAEELLLRMIWHLQLAGFDAARQRNPSGAISNDKLNVLIEGQWRAFDVFMDYGQPHQTTRVIFYEVFPSNPLAYPGVPD
jgi:hypothetical protein